MTQQVFRVVRRAAHAAAALGLLLFIAPMASHAAMMSAQDLLNACAGDATARATCDGYLMAATDIAQRREGHGNGKVCVPETVTIDQVRDAVLNVGQHGRAARAPAGLGLVAAALRRTWPCEARGEPGAPQGTAPGAPRQQ